MCTQNLLWRPTWSLRNEATSRGPDSFCLLYGPVLFKIHRYPSVQTWVSGYHRLSCYSLRSFTYLTYVLCFKVIHIDHQQRRSPPAYASLPQASWSRLLECFTPLLLSQFQFLPFPLFVALGNRPFKIGNDCRELLKCAVRLLALRFMIFPTFTSILADPNCPPNSELCLLSSGRRCTKLQCRTRWKTHLSLLPQSF